MYYLYIKTHNVTNLKYLGYTSSIDPHKYLGSGTYWVRHLKKYGYNYSTTILLATSDAEDIKATGIFFSKLFGVVKSDDWANLKLESLDGGWEYVNANISEKRREQLRENGRITGLNNKNTVSVKDPDGRVFRVSKEDPRFISGQLVGSTKDIAFLYDKAGNKVRVSKNSNTDTGLHGNNYGKHFITNGTINKMVTKDYKVPEGWYVGVSNNKNKHNVGKMWVSNGVEEKMILKDTPLLEGWKKGRLKKT